MERIRYWKLAVAAIGIVVLAYHLFYLYDVIDYYVIHEPPMEKDNNTLERLLTLIEYNPPPHYVPYQVFIFPLINDIPFLIKIGEYGVVLAQLIFGSITLPLWISAVVFFIFRSKKQKRKVGNENPLVDQ